jgi:hypothetical protein
MAFVGRMPIVLAALTIGLSAVSPAGAKLDLRMKLTRSAAISAVSVPGSFHGVCRIEEAVRLVPVAGSEGSRCVGVQAVHRRTRRPSPR